MVTTAMPLRGGNERRGKKERKKEDNVAGICLSLPSSYFVVPLVKTHALAQLPIVPVCRHRANTRPLFHLSKSFS